MAPSIQAQRVHAALETIADAKQEVLSVMQSEYPIGSRIAWSVPRSAYAGEGSVLRHGHGERIKVHNDATGKDYWICLSRVL